jgi:hypothetical protein
MPASLTRLAALPPVQALERDALDRWWFDLGDTERTEALRLGAADPIPESMAVRLLLYGVGVDTAALVVHDGARRHVLHAQPSVLADYLDGVRALL